jgi:hypothetical protein
MRRVQLLVVMLSVSIFALAADSPFTGTWKFNPAKGHPTPPLPKSVVAHIELNDTTFRFSEEYVDDKNQETKVSYEAKLDGMDYPVTGDPDIDSISLHRVNDRKIEFTTKKAGKVVSTFDATVSKDGQSTMLNGTDYDLGKAEKWSAVYDKQ